MPRQRLYHTKEAKMEANRRKAREHYQRNKEDICAKRRLRYSNRKARDAAQASSSPLSTAGEPTTTLPMEETISVPQSNVEALQMEVSASSTNLIPQHSTEPRLRDGIERAGANEENDGLEGHTDTIRESREKRKARTGAVKKEHARRTRRRSTKLERAQQASKNRDTRVNEENQVLQRRAVVCECGRVVELNP